MKTNKQLPKLFYIQENDKTNKYCKKLRLMRNNLTTKDDYGDYLVFEDYEYKDAYFKANLDYLILRYPKAVFINLSDYIDQEEPIQSEQKWQSKTRGGDDILGLQETFDGYWVVKTEHNVYLCLPNGEDTGGNDFFDLIYIDKNIQRKEELQAQINKLQEELNSLEK